MIFLFIFCFGSSVSSNYSENYSEDEIVFDIQYFESFCRAYKNNSQKIDTWFGNSESLTIFQFLDRPDENAINNLIKCIDDYLAIEKKEEMDQSLWCQDVVSGNPWSKAKLEIFSTFIRELATKTTQDFRKKLIEDRAITTAEVG